MNIEKSLILNTEIKNLCEKINEEQNENPNKNSLTIRITIFGEEKCGKTSLINCYLNKSFSSENEDTIINMYAKKIIINGFNVNLVITELNNDQLNSSIFNEIISESHIIFLCYNININGNISETFIDKYINNINEINEKIPIFIVECKFDLISNSLIDSLKIYKNNNEKTNSGNEINKFIDLKRNKSGKNICGYYITSSLLNINIDNLFNDAIKTVCFPYLDLIINTEKNNEGNKKKKNKKIDENELYEIMKVDENGCLII